MDKTRFKKNGVFCINFEIQHANKDGVYVFCPIFKIYFSPFFISFLKMIKISKRFRKFPMNFWEFEDGVLKDEILWKNNGHLVVLLKASKPWTQNGTQFFLAENISPEKAPIILKKSTTKSQSKKTQGV